MSFSLLCAFYWHLVRQTETGYSNFTLALSVAKQGRTLLLFYSTPILAGFKAIFIFGDAALLPFISRETNFFAPDAFHCVINERVFHVKQFHFSAGVKAIGLKKQLLAPVWQAGPICST